MDILVIKIQTKQSFIPIQLGDLEIKFDITDDAINRLRNGYKDMQSDLESIGEGVNEEEVIEQTKLVLEKGFDFLYGKGTFDKIYELSPSVLIAQEYFELMLEAVTKELDARGIGKTGNVNKYLAKK